MQATDRTLALNLAIVADEAARRRSRPKAQGRTLTALRADLVAARTAAGMTQEDVAARMGTTKSAVSRLERGVRTRPTLRTVECYARAVGAAVEIRIRWRQGT